MRRDPLIDTLAGNYRLVERLGAGGMGEVYKGVHKDIGSKVAIKLLHAMAARDKSLQERFLLEAKAVNRIEHPGVVKVVDAGRTEGGRPFLVMELLDGHSLHELNKRKQLSIAQACRAVIDVLDALAAAHAAGVVHRDLKPANLFRTRDGRTVVLDFGVAKLMSSDAPVRLTATGSAIGTPHYMAPEQIRGKPVTPAVDIYAVGVVLFELVCGRRPFDHDDEDGVMAGHLERRPPPPRALEPSVPLAVQDVILAALQKEPERRPASAAAMRDALRAAIAAEPGAPVDEGRSAWARPGKAPPLPPTPDSSSVPTVPARIPRTEPQDTPSGVRVHRARSSRLKLFVIAGAALFALLGIVLVVYAATRSREEIDASTAVTPVAKPIAVAPDAALDAPPALPFTGELPPTCAQLVTVDPIGVADERHAEVKATFFRRCEEDLWSPQTITCFVDATTIPDFASCVAALTATQRERLQAALDAPRVSPPVKKHVEYARVRIDSTPNGASVYVGGRLIGKTPLVTKVLPRELAVELVLAGYTTKRLSIDARPDRENVIAATLRRRNDTELMDPFEIERSR